MDLLIEKWDEILLDVKNEYSLTDMAYKTWLKNLKVYKMEGNKITIQAPTEHKMFLKVIEKYKLPLKVKICEFLELDDCELEFIVLEEEPTVEIKENKTPSAVDQRMSEANLNPRYTFDTFIVGNNNRFAQAAALAVADSPGEVYNPLFIYGGAGLGKTHLMQSIAHYIIEHNENSKVLYVTSEKFTTELITNIRNRNNSAMEQFRDKYRNIDVLLVDDIQFIIGKESTQEEFFHTFNSLHNENKQIIISSDKPPKDMEIFDERFRSRFEWGLTADISVPDYETRMAILHKKEEMDGYNINEEVIKYIAANIKSNIRELEGALNKVVATSKLQNTDITMDLAIESLKDIIASNNNKIVTPDYIISIVSDHYNIPISDIVGNKRNSKVVIPRQITMYLCREILDIPLKTIGRFLGNRDHTTIMHGIEKIEKEMKTDENLRSTIEILISQFQSQN